MSTKQHAYQRLNLNSLANLTGGTLHRGHDRGLLPLVKHLLVEHSYRDRREVRNAALHVVPMVVGAVVDSYNYC